MKKIFSLLFAAVVGLSATTMAQENALQQVNSLQQKKVYKERAAQAPAQISRPRKAPATTQPTASVLESTFGFHPSGKLVLCFYFDATPCNQVVLTGSFNNWSTSISECVNFANLGAYDSNYEGWYCAEVDWVSGIEAKPIQLTSDDKFDWENQAGDQSAWIHIDGNTADVSAGYPGEADVTYPSAGVYYYEIAYWKNHYDQCATCHYTLVMEDYYNDGWDGNGQLKITEGTHEMYFRCEYGESPKTVKVPYYGGDVKITWVSGSCTTENTISIVAPNGKGLFYHSGISMSDGEELATLPSSTDFCGVNPNPDEPQNVKAVLVDRKMQISWDAVTGAEKYRVSVTAPNGNVIVSSVETGSTSFETGSLPAKGDYTIIVASVDNTGLQMGATEVVQNIDLAPMSSAKVTVLVPSDCGMDVSEGLWITWKGANDATNHIEKMTSLGGRKFSITFNPNDYTYDFYVMNKENITASGVHRTYSCLGLCYPEFCFVVSPLSGSNHEIISDEDCTTEDFDYRPYNLKATPLTGDSMRFEWDVKNPTDGSYYVYYHDEEGTHVNVGIVAGEVDKLHYVVDAKFNVSQATEFSSWEITYDDHWGWYQSVKGGSFTVNGGAYVPSDLLVTPNTDGTYTITWKTQSAPDHYYFYIEKSDYSWSANANDLTEASYTTPTLDAGYEYYVTVQSHDAENNSIGVAYTTFSTSTIAETAFILNVYIPQSAGLSSTEGYALLWNYPGFAKQVTPLTLDSNRWYSTKINVTKDYINVSLINAQTEEKATEEIAYKSPITGDAILIANKDQAGKRFLGDVLADYNGSDLCPYNLQAEAKNGQLILTWDAAQDAPEYIVYTYNAQGEDITYYYSEKKQYTINVANDTVATWGWGVIPESKNGSSSLVTEVYAPEPVVIQPSPYIPKNLKATPNSDGTYTISWDAPEASDANKYYVYAYAPNGDYVLTKEVNAVTNARTPVLTQAGTYRYTVYAYGKNDRSGWARSSFELATVAVRDVTVRILVHDDEQNILTSTILFAAYNSNTKSYEYVTPTDEGNGWFSHTFTTTEPALKFLAQTNYTTYNCTIVGDTCMQFQNGIQGAACDAVPLDRRIIPGSLTAEPKAGQVKFSWDAKDLSDSYRFCIYDESDNTLTTQYIYGAKEFYYAVPAWWDGKVVTWGVRPFEPVYLAEEKSSTTVTIEKSTVELSNLKLDTEDTITLNFSWESTDPTLHYEVLIYCDGYTVKQEVVTTNSYQYTAPVNGTYTWYVRPLYPSDDTPAGQYVEGEGIKVTKSVEDLVTNLQGSSTGYTLHFSWQTTAPAVSAGLLKSEAGGSYTILGEYVLTENSLDYTVVEEGMYLIRLYALIEYAPGRYEDMYKSYLTSAQVFNRETNSIKLSSTEGGYIWPEGLSGNYPKGYEVEISAHEDAHYRFVKWSDGVKDAYRTLTINSDYDLTAIFERIPEYTITINAGEHGQVSMNGVDWGTTFSDKFEEGDGLYIYAQEESGYTFYQWSDGNKDQNRYIGLTSDTTLTAIFKPICTLTIETPVNGSINFTGDYIEKVGNVYTIAYGTQVTLTAQPNMDYRFTGWSDGVKTVQNIFIIEADKTINATFEAAGSTPKYNVDVYMDMASDGNGSVSGNGQYYEGDLIILTATPNENSEFIQWSDGNTDNPRTYTVTGNATLEALINLKRLNLKLIATEGGTVNFTDSVCKYGASVECIATPNEHYHFNGWSDNNTFASRYEYVTADITLTANFEADQYTITFLNEDGSFLEAAQWGYGSTPECSKTPTKKTTAEYTYKFNGWSPAVEKVTDDAVYTATFKASKRTYVVTFVDWNGKVLKTEDVVYGEAATAPTAPAREGYTFIGWDKDFSNITEDLTVTAQYKPNSQAIDNTDAKNAARKVMEGDRIYIIMPDGRKYTVLGEKID